MAHVHIGVCHGVIDPLAWAGKEDIVIGDQLRHEPVMMIPSHKCLKWHVNHLALSNMSGTRRDAP